MQDGLVSAELKKFLKPDQIYWIVCEQDTR
jgi:hypothetical protein